ncbi:MAG: hypothetical protein P8R01_09110 [Gammaproteobacteria bacterium]|nr:hypothetical protein [Gammaproteobacteria bacterium]
MARNMTSFSGCAAIVLSLSLLDAYGAENDIQLLTIEGNLIRLSETFDSTIVDRQDAVRLVHEYHRLLPEDLRTDVESLHQQILKLLPDFEVAYAAADSAEITHVMSEIDSRWASIQGVHRQTYALAVVSLLNEAYQLLLPAFDEE